MNVGVMSFQLVCYFQNDFFYDVFNVSFSGEKAFREGKWFGSSFFECVFLGTLV